MSLPCLRCVPIYQHSREAKNGVVILRLHINQYIRIMEKITFNQLKEDYFNDDVCMAEVLASTPATGLTIEQAFYLYIYEQRIGVIKMSLSSIAMEIITTWLKKPKIWSCNAPFL